MAAESDITMDRAFAGGADASQTQGLVLASEANAGLLLGSALLIAVLGGKLLRRQ